MGLYIRRMYKAKQQREQPKRLTLDLNLTLSTKGEFHDDPFNNGRFKSVSLDSLDDYFGEEKSDEEYGMMQFKKKLVQLSSPKSTSPRKAKKKAQFVFDSATKSKL